MHPEFVAGWQAAARGDRAPTPGAQGWAAQWASRPPPLPRAESTPVPEAETLEEGRRVLAAALSAVGDAAQPLSRLLGIQVRASRPMTEARARRFFREGLEALGGGRSPSTLLRWAAGFARSSAESSTYRANPFI
ncbi:MAG: hypothetical protein AAF627_00380 [Myxococcota bacterium]